MAHETRRLAEFVSRSRYEDLPAAAVHQAKRHILDTLGAGLQGWDSEPAKAVVKTVALLGGTQECTIIGRPHLSSQFNAALANGTIVYSTLMDDFYSGRGMAHPGNHIVPASLAVAEHSGVDGRAFLNAVVIGYEITCRSTDAAGMSQDQMGFYVGSTNGHFGSAAAASSILGLDEDRTAHAFGLAGTQVGGIKERGIQINISQGFHAGKAASSGILAALLAREGLVAGDTVFEGPGGYLAMFSTDPDPSQLVDGLGDEYRINRVGFKLYPAAAPISSTIDAAIRLHDKVRIAPADIERIVVRSHRLELTNHNLPDPDRRLAALRSNQYCVARALLRGSIGPADFLPPAINDPLTRSLMERVRIKLDPEIEAAVPRLFGSRVAVHTKDGGIFEEIARCAHGMVDEALTDDEVIEKFFASTNGVIKHERAEQVVAQVWEIEQSADVRGLAQLLRLDASARA